MQNISEYNGKELNNINSLLSRLLVLYYMDKIFKTSVINESRLLVINVQVQQNNRCREVNSIWEKQLCK